MRLTDRRFGSTVALFAVLLGSSGALYLLQLVLFRRTSDTFFYMLQDAAFLPVQAILVTFVLNACLATERGFLLGLLDNPNLLEREGFTDTLLAVVHLAEELSYRETLAKLPESDLKHLAADLQRAYRLLLAEWIGYVRHLKVHYPYMFSLVVRTHPFRKDGSAVVG